MIEIKVKIKANKTECQDGDKICNAHDVLRNCKGKTYHYCYLFITELDGFNRCAECLKAGERK